MLAERSGLPPDDLTVAVRAALLNAALRAAVEHWVRQAPAPDTLDALNATMTAALLTATQGLPD